MLVVLQNKMNSVARVYLPNECNDLRSNILHLDANNCKANICSVVEQYYCGLIRNID